MYPSDGYVNTAFTYNYDDFNPSLGIQDLSSSSSCLFNPSSPFNLYEDEAIYSQHLHAILCATNQAMVATNDINSVTTGNSTENYISSQNDVHNLREYICAGGNSTTDHQPVAKKKMGKKDRHSKINTAHGPRDRRMRLSLDVARKFFKLQDMLGYDKASKTVEWLLEQSKGAIGEQFGGLPHMNKDSSIVTISASSTSDCDVVSGIDHESMPRTSSSKTVLPAPTCSKEKRTRSVRKPTFHPRAKESREKAKERARERTKEKRKQLQLDHAQQSARLMTWRPFGTGEELVGSAAHNTSKYDERLLVEEVEQMQNARKQQLQSQGIREESVNIIDPNNIFFRTGNCNPSVLFNYQQTSGAFQEQYHQFTDFQFVDVAPESGH